MSTTGTPERQGTEAAWRLRYRAATATLPGWGIDAPDRLTYASNQSGSWQVHAWDRAAGTSRQVTDHPTGVIPCAVTADGAGVIWFQDARGDEIGRWQLQPFAGGEVVPLLSDVEPAWSAGLAIAGDGQVAVGTASRGGFTVHVGAPGSGSRELYHHEQAADVAGFSRNGRIVFIQHSEHGDQRHPALRAYDPDGGVVAELWDGKGYGLYAVAVAPLAGDERVAILHERTGRLRPALWDPRAASVVDVPVDLPGEVEVAGWWPDAGALLLLHNHLGRGELYRAELATGRLERLEHPPGSISAARVRPDGAVWYRWSSGASPPEFRAIGAPGAAQPDPATAPGLVLQGPAAPPGRPYQAWTFANPDGHQVHGFFVEPPGPRPHPTVLLVHGGPQAQDADAFTPQVQAWVDHGFAVGLVNYRGSSGHGKAWLDALEGDPGRPEVEDVVAGRDDLIAAGIADLERVVIAGASWGGYVTLYAVGTVPDGWRAALAVVPVADYVAAFSDESEELQAFDRALFGGTPDELPDLYRERSPITWAEQVRAPVLLMVGENDTRCPLRQVLNYADRLRELGKHVELDRFDAGHGSLVTDERIRQMEILLAFAARHVPGVAAPRP